MRGFILHGDSGHQARREARSVGVKRLNVRVQVRKRQAVQCRVVFTDFAHRVRLHHRVHRFRSVQARQLRGAAEGLHHAEAAGLWCLVEPQAVVVVPAHRKQLCSLRHLDRKFRNSFRSHLSVSLSVFVCEPWCPRAPFPPCFTASTRRCVVVTRTSCFTLRGVIDVLAPRACP